LKRERRKLRDNFGAHCGAPPKDPKLTINEDCRRYELEFICQTAHVDPISGKGARGFEPRSRLMPLTSAGVQNYFAVPDFSACDTVLIGILDHVTS
jgi:hypothetical protein